MAPQRKTPRVKGKNAIFVDNFVKFSIYFFYTQGYFLCQKGAKSEIYTCKIVNISKKCSFLFRKTVFRTFRAQKITFVPHIFDLYKRLRMLYNTFMQITETPTYLKGEKAMATNSLARPRMKGETLRAVRKSVVSRARLWQVYVFLLPAVVYMVLFAYKPMYGVIIAFKDYSARAGILGSQWVGLDNFSRLVVSYWFPVILKNTLSVSLLSLVVGFPIPIILALLLNEVSNGAIRKTIQTVSYAPHFISTVVICGMLQLMLSPTSGVINALLQELGFEKVFFLQEGKMFKWVYVISGTWQGAGWSSIIYFAALSGVDKSLLEAADIDGASRLQKVWYINVPVIIPTIVTLLILQCGSLLSVGYEKVYLLQTNATLEYSEVISTYVYKVGLVQNDFGFSTAIGIFNSIVNSAVLILANTLSNKIGKTGLW